MKHTVTLADIARHCKVAPSTVSLSIQGGARVHPATRARVLQAAMELGYSAEMHESARRLARHRFGLPSRTGIIAILFPHNFMETSYFFTLFHGISSELMQTGYGMLAVSLNKTPGTPQSAFPPSLLRGEVDAIIINTLSQDLLNFITQHPAISCPIVKFVNPGPDMSCVTTNNQLGMYQATRHLLAHGHRALLFLSPGNSTRHTEAQRAGIRQALSEFQLNPQQAFHEIPFEEGWLTLDTLRTIDSAHRVKCGVGQSLCRYLADHPEITSLLCCNDAVAHHAWYTLRNAGYRIPDDYSLIGYDDTDPLLNADGENLLTTVRLPLRDMGRAAARLAMQRISGDAPEDRVETFPTELIIRGTTGPAPSNRARPCP